MTIIVRPQTLIFPLIAMVLVNLDRAISEKKAPSFSLLIITLLWSNLHASHALIFVFLFFYTLEMIWLSKASEWFHFLKKMIVMSILVILTMGITPYGFQSLLFSFGFVSSSIDQVILEWQSVPDLIGKYNSTHYVRHLFFPILIFLFSLYFLIKEKINWPRFIGVLFFLVSAFNHFRFLQIFCFYTCFVSISHASNYLKARSVRTKREEIFVPFFLGSLVPPLLGLAVFAMPREPLFFPIHALNVALDSGVKGRVINSYNLGGFLIFNNIRTFQDGRAELFLNNIVPEFSEAIKSEDNEKLNVIIDKYRIEWAFLESDREEDKKFKYLPGWKNLYRDEIASAYVKID